MYNMIGMIKKKQKKNIERNANKEPAKHMVELAKTAEEVYNNDESTIDIPDELNLLDHPTKLVKNMGNFKISEFEKMVNRLYLDLHDYWDSYIEHAKKEYPLIENVDFLMVKNRDMLLHISKMYRTYQNPDTFYSNKFIDDMHNYIDAVCRNAYNKPDSSTSSNMSTFHFGVDIHKGPIMSVILYTSEMLSQLFLFYNNLSYDDILKMYQFRIKHEIGHVLHTYDLFYTLPLYEFMVTKTEEQKKTNELMEEWEKQDPETRECLYTYYYGKCPTEVEANKCVGLGPEGFIEIDKITRECEQKVLEKLKADKNK